MAAELDADRSAHLSPTRRRTIRFREEDLRVMRSLTVVRAGGRERNLTHSGMHDLLATYQPDLRWD